MDLCNLPAEPLEVGAVRRGQDTEGLGPPDIVVTTDSIGLCRVAANRLGPSELEAGVEGDAALLGVVLVAATAFAAD